MRNKLQSLLGNLNQGLIGREQTVKLTLLTLLAGENILLVGPPGTGKSFIARRMADSLAGDNQLGDDYFEYLLTKFSTPEEIFGPLSISELKQDRFKRNTAGYLPTVKTAFLDEIFKSSSSILNALLTILNERVYHNGAEVQPVPLRALIAASNELPTEQTELSALYDRFLVRVFVDYVHEHQREHFFRPFEIFELQPDLCITDAELAQIATAAAQVEIPAEVAKAIQRVWIKHKEAFKEDRRESLSDRRLVKVIQLLRVSAVTNGRTEMDLSDVLLLKDCLWNHQDNAEQVLDIINKELKKSAFNIHEKSKVDNKDEVIKKSFKTNIKNTTKGFLGGGTEEDPFLINTVEDLFYLSDSEVGLEGYYFKQLADIDISEIEDWPEIDFIGNYDGSLFKIYLSNSSYRNFYLFKNIKNSSFINLNLENLSLALYASDSIIERCCTNVYLITECVDVKIKYCEAATIVYSGQRCEIFYSKSICHLIGESLDESNVFSCHSGNSICKHSDPYGVKNSVISNCLVSINITDSKNEINGGIVNGLLNSELINCYAYGEIAGQAASCFSGIVGNIKYSKVSNCALGEFLLSNRYTNRSLTCYEGADSGFYRSSADHKKVYSSFEKNISIDININSFFNKSNLIADNDITCLPYHLFNKRYFENELHWDFDNIWIWDSKSKNPTLRYAGAKATVKEIDNSNIESILTKSLKYNIWL